jgi:hypothetical protein
VSDVRPEGAMKVLPVLVFFTLFFTGITLSVFWLRPTDTQIHTVFTGLLTGFSGATLMFLTGTGTPPNAPPAVRH